MIRKRCYSSGAGEERRRFSSSSTLTIPRDPSICPFRQGTGENSLTQRKKVGVGGEAQFPFGSNPGDKCPSLSIARHSSFLSERRRPRWSGTFVSTVISTSPPGKTLGWKPLRCRTPPILITLGLG